MKVTDIAPGGQFMILEPNAEDGVYEVTQHGQFETWACYDEARDGWFGAKAVIDGVSRVLDVQAAGLICAPDGMWAEAFTLAVPTRNTDRSIIDKKQ